MKKIAILCFALSILFFSANLRAQTISSVTITQPIQCFGDLATIQIQLNQTTPPTTLKAFVGYYIGTFFVPIVWTNNTTVTNITINQLPAQNYEVRIVDSTLYYSTTPNGTNPTSIYHTYMINVTQPAALSNTGVVTNPLLCHGDCDAVVNTTISGGTPPYYVGFNGGQQVSLSGFDSTYINLCSGTYSLNITDDNGCSVSSSSPTSITIVEPTELIPAGFVSSDYNGRDISCFGASDGEITSSVTGGTPPYTYSIDGINYTSNDIFSSLPAGTYTIYYRDANNCDTLESITLNNPPDLSGSISISQQVSCFGGCDGVLDFQVNNVLIGTPPYTYSIDGGSTFQSSNIFSGLCGNLNYTITVKDDNGCIFSASKFLAEPSEITFSVSTLSYNGYGVSCAGFSDGEISILLPTGGQAPYTFSIDGVTFSSATVYSGLSSGTYLVTVKDANGCTMDSVVVLTEPLPFSINYTVINSISCPSICDGSISVNPTNGVSPILYDLTGYPTQSGISWNGLCGDITFGTYTLNAIDDNGCAASTTVSLIEPLPFLYTVDSVAETCNLINGSASITVNQGGTPPYAYLWDDPSAQITSTASNLATGLYVVRVTDANGCMFMEDIFVEELDISLTFDSVPPCNNAGDGSATVFANGTPPYSILWSTGATTNTITGLTPGYYSVTVSDATGCSIVDSVEVPASSIVDITLDPINSNLNVLCNGYQSDTITVNATGGTGIGTYQYYIPSIFPTPQYNNIFSGLYAGTYPVYAVDANGCSDSVMVTIFEPNVIYFSASSSDVSCNSGSDGSIFVDSVSGGTPPYFYTWSSGQNTSIVSNVSAGTYTVTVTDVNGCASNPTQVTVTVDQPSQLASLITVISHSSCAGTQTAANGEISVIANGGTPGYNYLWSTGSTSTNISLLFPGIYTVEITDGQGCVISDTAEILPGTNPTLNIMVQNVSCYGANDGMITTSAINGTPPYQFSNDGGATFVPSGTPFGPTGGASYFITVVDSEGCTDSDSIFVNEPDELVISSLVPQNVLCYDSANGQITVNAIGGTGGYSYLWNNGQTTQTAISLMPSTYNVTVTDSMNCSTTSVNQNITQPDSLYALSLFTDSVNCYGGADGAAYIDMSGGTAPYAYQWNGGSNWWSGASSGYFAGNYTVIVSDDNGCSRTYDFTIHEPDSISVQFVRDSVTCVGGNDGQATAIITGGTPIYTLLWDNGDTLNTVSTFSAGYQTLTIIDDNSCFQIDSVEILEPSFSVSIDSLLYSPITCHDANNASVTVLATGGQLPYVYSNTNGFQTQSNIGFINLSPNQYIMYVRDARGCIDRDTILVSQPDSLYIDTTVFTHISCYGSNDGAIQAIHAIGGTQPYMYSVNGGASHSNMAYFNGYGPGTYTIEVTDTNHCAAQDIITIIEPDELEVVITTSLWNGYQIRCYGDTSGTASFSINGGVGPYTKTVLDALGNVVFTGTSNYITGISAGIYTFLVQDSYGCQWQGSVTYIEPDPISHNFLIDHITCSGWSNGTITDSVYGGVGSPTTYIYAWDTGDSTYSLDSLSVGTYFITVTDENNCISTSSATINSSGVLSSSVSNTQNPTCWNYCNGEIELNISGGVPNINSSGANIYSYQWNDDLQQTTQTAIGLCVNGSTNTSTWDCIITDALGCSVVQSATLTQPEKLESSIVITGEISCYGGNDGKLKASTIGGNPGNIIYTWNTGQSGLNSNLNNISSGTYVVVVEDVLGCMDTTDIFLSQPDQLIAQIDPNDIEDVSCHGFSDGAITVSVSGGTINVLNSYTYDWTPGGSGSAILSNLDTGVYFVKVTDVNGCVTMSNSVYISQPMNPLSLFVDSTDETCLTEGSATAYVLGGTAPYNYVWSPGSQTTVTATSLIPNTTYVVEVIDDNGCIITEETHINGYRNIFLPDNNDYLDSTICLGKSVFIDIEEKPGHVYLWNTGDNTASITVSPEDPITIYTLTVIDPMCPTSPFEVQATFNVMKLDINPVANPNPLVLGDQVTISSSYMYSSYQWTWDYQDTSQGMSITDYPESSTWYYVEVTDGDGCKGVDSIYVVVGAVPYDAISPNGDGWNDEWEILDIQRYPTAEIQIFNRWGSLIYSSTGAEYINNKWDGTYENEPLPVGTYYYTINLNDGSELQTGPVTIVR